MEKNIVELIVKTAKKMNEESDDLQMKTKLYAIVYFSLLIVLVIGYFIPFCHKNFSTFSFIACLWILIFAKFLIFGKKSKKLKRD